MREQNITIQPESLRLRATQRTRGDGDFDGNGPNMYLYAFLYVANQYQIGLKFTVRFQETRRDWTTYEGSFSGIVYDVRNQGGRYKVLNVITPAFSKVERLEGYGEHSLGPYGMEGIVREAVAIGDEDGGVFGGNDQPEVTVHFNSVRIEVEDPPSLRDFPEWFEMASPPPRLIVNNDAAYKRDSMARHRVGVD